MKQSTRSFLVFLLASQAFGSLSGNAKFAISGGYCLNVGTISTHGIGGSASMLYGKHEFGATANAGFGLTDLPYIEITGPDTYENMGRMPYRRLSIGAGLSYYYYPFAPIAGRIAVAPGATAGVWYHRDYTDHKKTIFANIFEFGGPRLKVLIGQRFFFWSNEIGFLLNFSKFTPQFRTELALRL